ncbi:MAG: PKD domain-containing protein [Flavobacteriales bacterium]
MSIIRRLSSLTLMFACALLPASAQTTRILFIGNSYTYSNDLPGMLRQVALSLGDTVVTQMVAPGGFTFQGHSSNTATLNAIDQGEWDHVVLQEQSQRPAFPPEQVSQEVLPYANQLVSRIRSTSPCAAPVFMMTWGRENGDQQNCAFYPPLCTYAGMQQRLWESYVLMAMENDAHCAPVGSVWRSYRSAHPEAALYTDGSHPNVLGTFIAATTLYVSIFQRDCTASSFAPVGVSTAAAAEVRATASATVLDSLDTWNIGVNDPVALADHQVIDGLNVLFANNSIGGVQHVWYFGDGATSLDADPLHTYAQAGIYTASLVVEDSCGRRDSLSFDVDLNVGITEGDSPMVRVRVEGTLLVVEHPSMTGTFELLDATGRSLLLTRTAGTATAHWSLPRSAAGMCMWRLRSDAGPAYGGRILLP